MKVFSSLCWVAFFELIHDSGHMIHSKVKHVSILFSLSINVFVSFDWNKKKKKKWEQVLAGCFRCYGGTRKSEFLFLVYCGTFSRLTNSFSGLDGAGKTTILYRLQIGEVVTTIPTIGFNVETVSYKNIKFQVWDLGGQTSIRPYWRCYYANTDAIIYVVDSSDVDRVATSGEELKVILLFWD